MTDTPTDSRRKYDISIVHPEMREADFNIRGQGMSQSRLSTIKKGLRTLHTAEYHSHLSLMI